MPIRKQVIHAVHDMDLAKLLCNLGLDEALKKGELTCGVCGEPITRDNLGCFYSEENEVKVCCAKMECLERILSNRRSIHG